MEIWWYFWYGNDDMHLKLPGDYVVFSSNGPRFNTLVNPDAVNPYHYIYLNANVETMTLGDSLLWLDHELLDKYWRL